MNDAGSNGPSARNDLNQARASDDLLYHNPGALDEILEAPLDDPLFSDPPAYPSSTDGPQGQDCNDKDPSNFTPSLAAKSKSIKRGRVEIDTNDSLEMMGGDLPEIDFAADLDFNRQLDMQDGRLEEDYCSPRAGQTFASPCDNPERSSSKERKVRQVRPRLFLSAQNTTLCLSDRLERPRDLQSKTSSWITEW